MQAVRTGLLYAMNDAGGFTVKGRRGIMKGKTTIKENKVCFYRRKNYSEIIFRPDASIAVIPQKITAVNSHVPTEQERWRTPVKDMNTIP